jgi:hypothetical protein
MKEPTMQEVLELVEFDRDFSGILHVKSVKGSVWSVGGSVGGNVGGSVGGNIKGDVAGYVDGTVGGFVGGSVKGSVYGDIEGDVGGSVIGDVGGSVGGTIDGCAWQFVETPKEKAIRLIREGKGEEAIKVLEESE